MISLSPEAAEHLRRDAGERVLRIAFTTGCGGSGYRLSWEPEPAPDDALVEIDGIRVALDAMASSRLEGAVIAFDPEEEGFVIDHPDAAIAIWCG
ncbi:MAG: HesB/IscA family protein [Thermoanaerobaculia bacterium]